MMWLRASAFAITLCVVACASPSATQQTADAETAAMAPLKHAYPDVVMGFDVKGATLVISLDLQAYEAASPDDVAAMERQAVTEWRGAWKSAHPGAHQHLEVRFIDFIGRKIDELFVSV